MSDHSPVDNPPQALPGPTLVLALGSPLRGDDGVGKAVIECLQDRDLPPGITVLDGGTPGLETILLFEGYARVIIVDAAEMNQQPGQWRRFTTQEASLTANDLHARVTVHYAGLAEALALGEALDILPDEIVIYGVQPERIDWSGTLSDPVQAAVPAVCAAILDELQIRP
ncbi:MAG: hydrogenase maturation protease [Anaerolineae bacterium]|nr:hydrogenase maturation protease [Anaerolineae bacterium]